VLRIFIALKNLPPSAGFEEAKLGSNGKHANHYTTEATAFMHASAHLMAANLFENAQMT
jgi:hypothetical protein